MVNLNLVLILKVIVGVTTFALMVVGGIVVCHWLFVNVVSGDGRLPDEVNHGVSVYYVDSLNDYFTDGVTCANWVLSPHQIGDQNDYLELVKYPQYIGKSICASYTEDE